MHPHLDAWTRLEGENLGGSGVFQVRLFGESSLDLFALLDLPEGKVGIQLQVAARSVPAVGAYPSAAGFRTRVERSGAKTRITLLLEQREFRSVFGEMCFDVLRACLRAGSDETRAVHELVDRLVAWKELFSGAGARPLGEREQMGLVGELTFLDALLDRSVDPAEAVKAWRGPFSDPHDFHVGAVHIEVKSTGATDARVTRISNLAQLDPAGTTALFLWHYRFEMDSGGGGRSLHGLVEKLRARLETARPEVRANFDDCLLKLGYLDLHASEHYDVIALAVRQTRTLKIGPDFPSLTRSSVPTSVREARYDLSFDHVSSDHDVRLDEAMAEICSAVASNQ
ncbi:MAG: PD-(D/E)XK motif protein [Byssovorax sp.]